MFELSTVLQDLEERVKRAREITARLHKISKLSMLSCHDELQFEILPSHEEEVEKLLTELEALATLAVELAKPIKPIPTTSAEIEALSYSWKT